VDKGLIRYYLWRESGEVVRVEESPALNGGKKEIKGF
jgi:hypothetical protein